MMRMLADVTAAVRLLTVLPVAGREGARPVRYFPLIGLIYGGLAAAAASAAAGLGVADGTGAVLTGSLVVALWAALSGFLHLDGLADTADAAGVRGDAARRLAVMRDSSIGAYGVTAIVLVCLMQVAAIAVIAESRAWWCLGVAPVLGRLGASAALMWRTQARTEGLGARYAETASVLAVAVMLLPLVGLLGVFPSLVHGAVVTAGVIVAVVLPGVLGRRIGGVTGDVLGATIVLTETAVLVMCALAGGLT